MNMNLVIARDWRGYPLKRVAMSSDNGLIYVANPALYDAVISGNSSAIGFPMRDVFSYDENLYNEIVNEYESYGKVEQTQWMKLKRYRN